MPDEPIEVNDMVDEETFTNLPSYAPFTPTEGPEVAAEWDDWLDGFQTLTRAMNIKRPKTKKDLLLWYIGGTTRKIFRKLRNTGNDEDYESAVKALNEHFSPKMNNIFLMNSALQIRQEKNETMDSFYIKIKEKIDLIKFQDMDANQVKELIILSHLVTFCQNNGLRKKALKDSLSLDDFLKDARAYERATAQAQEISQSSIQNSIVDAVEDREEGDVNAIGGRGRFKSKKRNFSDKRSFSQSRKLSCYKCGGSYPHMKNCPAENETCMICKKKGHFAKVCRNKNLSSRVNAIDLDSDEDPYEMYTIYAIDTKETKRYVNIEVGEKQAKFLIDTGASVNVITKNHIPENCVVSKPNKKLFSYQSNNPLKIVGTVKLPINYKGNKTEAEFHILEATGDNLLSCETSELMGIIKFDINEIKSTSTDTDIKEIQTTSKENKINKNENKGKEEDPTQNDEKLKSILQKYDDRFQGIGRMKKRETGEYVEVELIVDKTAEPPQFKYQPTPFLLRDKTEAVLDKLCNQDIIEPALGETKWVSNIVSIPRDETDDVRICVKSQNINKAIKRSKHPTPTLDDLINKANGCNYFSKLDMPWGYHQLGLAQKSRDMTTFATSKGYFRYKRLCFGLNSASEIFQREVENMLRGIPNQQNISDDILIFTKTKDEHYKTLELVFQRLRECNVTVSLKKCKFMKTSLRFYGHTFSDTGITAGEDKVEAIQKADAPSDVSELKSLLGMAQYVARFIPDFSTMVEPMRKLTREDEPWVWNDEQEAAFQKLKSVLSDIRTLNYFDKNLPTSIYVDASPVGLSGILTQANPDGTINVVSYGSRALSDVESRYSQIEREMMAVVWACEHYHLYIYGAQVIKIYTDHKPLLGLMKKTTGQSTARLEKFLLRLTPYKVELEHIPGNRNTADFLSRHPGIKRVKNNSEWIEEQLDHVCINAVRYYAEDGLSMDDIKRETSLDDGLQLVILAIQNQNFNNLPEKLLSFKHVQDELCTKEGLILRNDRVVIPESLHEKAIEIAHKSHQGIVKTKSLLRTTIWFPKIDSKVEKAVKNCLACQASTHGGNKHEPLKPSVFPEKVWQELSIDFCGPFGDRNDYLMCVMDDASKFPEIEIVTSTAFDSNSGFKAVAPRLDAILSRQGIPEVIRSDNGPPFNGDDFTNFLKSLNCYHRKVTKRHPQSNGEIERFMRTIEKFIRAVIIEGGNWRQELFRFLRHYRATPHTSTGVSPAELLNGRKLRTELPRYESENESKSDLFEKAKIRDERVKVYMKDLRDFKNNAEYHSFKIGDTVLVKQDKKNKFSTPFLPEPLEITKVQGSRITAESNISNRIFERDSSWFKPISKDCESRKKVSFNVKDDDDCLILDDGKNLDRGYNLRQNRNQNQNRLNHENVDDIQNRRVANRDVDDVRIRRDRNIIVEDQNPPILNSGRIIREPSYLKDYIRK